MAASRNRPRPEHRVQLTSTGDTRRELVARWASEHYPGFSLSPASADASLRRYFRLRRNGESLILMDSPPHLTDCRPFLEVAERLSALGLNVPRVLRVDLAEGILALSDFGDLCYLGALNSDNADSLYEGALAALLTLQTQGRDAEAFPLYDRSLLERELRLFDQWLLGRHLHISLNEVERRGLERVYQKLCDNALEQPKVWVHRDYHSRNLMVCAENNPGILDFQDAVIGPITYDLVSLLKDCYVAWPRDRVEGWALEYRHRLLAAGLEAVATDECTWMRWFDLMGIQRHLKAAGIFARLHRRDGKSGYLADIPRTLGYVSASCQLHEGLEPLAALLDRYFDQAMEYGNGCG
jgi:aminoglycoside/choline kinase family phosphotransferase